MWIIATVSTFAFAYLHSGIAEYAFAYGFLLTLIAMVTKSLYLPIIIHSLSNLFTLIFPNAWLFQLNLTVIPDGAYESSLLAHYVMLVIVTLGYAVLIFAFKNNLVDISRLLAVKFANKKNENSGSPAS
ncbi:MAG: CPBP family glutamic-type intramembrane protease [Pseudomonadota bacterium]